MNKQEPRTDFIDLSKRSKRKRLTEFSQVEQILVRMMFYHLLRQEAYETSIYIDNEPANQSVWKA